MILIDFNFSKIIGQSIIKELESYLPYFTAIFGEEIKNIIFYLFIISLPIGTMMITYISSLFLGKKFRFLDEETSRKYIVIRKFNKYGSLISCSRKSIYIGVVSIIIGSILLNFKFISSIAYFRIIINSIMCVILFFLIQDSISLINKFIYSLTHSRLNTILIQLFLLFSLIKFFKISTITFIVLSLIHIY